MTSDVSLTAALKNNILSLKGTDKNDAGRAKDTSAGLLQAQEKANSAAQTQDSVFAATTLNSRATGFTQVLEGLSDSIQTIKAAEQGVSDIAQLLGDLNKVLVEAKQNGESAELAAQYNSLLDQIDSVATSNTSAFKGTSLLNGDNVQSFFNADQSTSLMTQGRVLSSKSLGLSKVDFPGAPIESALSQVREARSENAQFGSSLANDLAVIQTRRDFTQNLVGTLTEGADKISVTNQNAEAATLLALQAKQQLEGSDISLASQAQEQILRFF